MELYSKTTRFALACNQSDKIIEPIQSRCVIVRYGKLTDLQVIIKSFLDFKLYFMISKLISFSNFFL